MDKQVSARMKIRKGELDGLQRHAAAIIRQAKQMGTKTPRYARYLDTDKTACEVREAYGIDRVSGRCDGYWRAEP
jgi:hypothetical protein